MVYIEVMLYLSTVDNRCNLSLSIFISVINLLLIYNKSLTADFLGKQNLDRSSLKIKDGNDWVWYFQDFDPKLKGINLQLYIYDDRGRMLQESDVKKLIGIKRGVGGLKVEFFGLTRQIKEY